MRHFWTPLASSRTSEVQPSPLLKTPDLITEALTGDILLVLFRIYGSDCEYSKPPYTSHSRDLHGDKNYTHPHSSPRWGIHPRPSPQKCYFIPTRSRKIAYLL